VELIVNDELAIRDNRAIARTIRMARKILQIEKIRFVKRRKRRNDNDTRTITRQVAGV